MCVYFFFLWFTAAVKRGEQGVGGTVQPGVAAAAQVSAVPRKFTTFSGAKTTEKQKKAGYG